MFDPPAFAAEPDPRPDGTAAVPPGATTDAGATADAGVTADVRATADACSRLVSRVLAAVDGAQARAREHDEDERMVGAEEIGLIALCEHVVRIAQGVQADAIQQLDVRRRAVMPDVDERTLTRSMFAEIALARQVSPPAGERSYALARALEDLPQTHGLLRDGTIGQGVAAAVCRETTFAGPEDRSLIDAAIAPGLAELTPRRAAREARRLVLEADPHAAFGRHVRASEERAVTFTPELDAMATLSVFAPAAQLVSAFERLDREASARRADGDPRTVRQAMADLAVEALSGAGVAVDGSTDIPVEVGVVMSPETLFSGSPAPVSLVGYGPIPAELGRRLATSDHAWVRRFFTAPDSDRLAGSDPRARRFSADVRRLIRVTDDRCAQPWCDCRIRHVDHIKPFARGGPSTADNAQGTCVPGNLVKEGPGWDVRAVADAAHEDTAGDEPAGAASTTGGRDGSRPVGGALDHAAQVDGHRVGDAIDLAAPTTGERVDGTAPVADDPLGDALGRALDGAAPADGDAVVDVCGDERRPPGGPPVAEDVASPDAPTAAEPPSPGPGSARPSAPAPLPGEVVWTTPTGHVYRSRPSRRSDPLVRRRAG